MKTKHAHQHLSPSTVIVQNLLIIAQIVQVMELIIKAIPLMAALMEALMAVLTVVLMVAQTVAQQMIPIKQLIIQYRPRIHPI